MLLTVLSVPWMLIPKPILLWIINNGRQKKAEAARLLESEQQPFDDDEEGDVEAGAAETGVKPQPTAGAHGHEEFEIGEVVIEQVIETIEFVLGTVSHTASYLRIWALSLAHQQLSLVFFTKTLTMGLEMSFPYNGIALYFLFAAWFGITLGVLLGMDVLECFLHTLRLHWVEFQSKFYKAGGEEFAPYSVKALVEPTGDM